MMKPFSCKNGAACCRNGNERPTFTNLQFEVEKGRSGCARIPQPPIDTLVPLDGENCIACKDRESQEQKHDQNKYLHALSYRDLCQKFIGAPLDGYQGFISPELLTYTLDPPLDVPPGQKAFNMVPPYPPTPVIDLGGKNVLVVGASRNIGLAVADTFLSKGCQVIGTSRHPECYDRKYNFPLLKLDVRSSHDVKEFFELLVRKHFTNRKIDILVICAGIHWMGMLADADGDDLTDIFNLNTSGPQRVVFRALPLMKHPRTRIITMGSIAGEAPGFIAGYSMSKRALQHWNDTHMVEALQRKALGLSQYEPTFTLIEPYFIESTIGLYESYVAAKASQTSLLTRGTNLTFNALQCATTIIHPILGGGPPCPAEPDLCSNVPQLVADAVYQVVLAPQPSVRYLVDALRPDVGGVGFVTASNTLSADDTINLAIQPFAEQIYDPQVTELSRQILEDAYCNPADSSSN